MAEGSTSSSLTSTSHTLTLAAGMAPASAFRGGVDPLALLDCLNPANRHAFLRPSPAIPAASLQLVKSTLESFAGTVSDEQQQRIKDANRKRKRSERVPLHSSEVLKLRKVHVEGFETGQVWQQAKRIISDTLKHSSEAVRELEESNQVTSNGIDHHHHDVHSEASSSDAASDQDEDDGSSSESGSDQSELGEFDEDDIEGIDEADFSDEEDLDEAGLDDDMEEAEENGTYQDDAHGLNDGFFSIDEFNRQSQWFEEQDAKGDPYTDHVSDEEEVDWDADPFAKPAGKGKTSKRVQGGLANLDGDEEEDGAEVDLGDDDNEESDEEEEGGPTFGNMNLFAPEGESDVEGDDGFEGEEDGPELNANDILYKDFFAPPPRKTSGPKERTEKKVRFEQPPEDDENLELAMASVKRDLFDVISDEDASLSDGSAGDPMSRRSAHEKRQAKVAEEIRRLEAASVAKRDWALTGEVSAAQRPQHSLLEEDLDFEFIGKQAPVITTEVSETIEDMIKRRILAEEFDDIMRRRPDAASVTADTRRGLVAVDDKKGKKSLAELYEEDYLKANNADTYVSKEDEKVQKEEQEVQRMWKDVSAKLDSLSNWHFKPRPAAPALAVVADVAAINVEDAQPTTAQGLSAATTSMLAPQEIYKPGNDTAAAGEVVAAGSGLPVARQEMTREEKRRRRRREKERGRKASGQKAAAMGDKARAKKDTMADLKKGGVRVINRKGEVVGLDGKKAKTAKPMTGGSYKL